MRQILVLSALACCGLLDAAADEVRLRGIVREQESQRPVVGAVVLLTNGRDEARVESDAAGQYECRLSPGIITGNVVELPVPLAKPLRAFRAPVEVPAGVSEQTLPPIDVRRGQSVRGRVIDAKGQPVAGAAVQAAWYVFEPWLESYARGPKWFVTRSDEKGEFSFTGIDPVDDPRLANRGPRFWAASLDSATETWATLPPDPDLRVELRLNREASVSLAGRVVDAAEKPIAGARIRVWTQWRNDDGFVLAQVPLALPAESEIVADADGHFQTPRQFSPKAEYSLMVSCDGYLPARGTWFKPGDGTMAQSPEIRLRKLRRVAGRVVDAQGRPLSGARVFQSGDGVGRTETTTDDHGGFDLPGVAEGHSFVFAEHAGYRFGGTRVVQSGEAVIALSRADEPAAPLVSLPTNVLPREEELALARQVIRPDVERALHSGSHDQRWDALFYWIRLDPADALERIDNGAIPNVTGDERDVLRTRIARAMVHDHADDAAAVANSIDDADRRARAFFELAGEVPTSDSETKRSLLNQALLAASQASEPSLRALWQACIADLLLDLGDDDQARTLLTEAGAVAATLPQAGGGASARRYIADVLARTDLSAALVLVRDIAEEVYRDRTLGKIAYRMAALQPAKAERVLAIVGDRHRRDSSTVRVCYRMATVDLDRAERLARQVASLYLRALAVGWTARGCAVSDVERARTLLDEAFNQLGVLAMADEARFHGPQTAAVAAAILLPVAEAIDPRIVPEYLLRAVSYRRAYSHDDQEELLSENATLALLLAQYDRATARRVLEPAADHLLRRALNESGLCGIATVYAACASDPRWAAALAEERPTDKNDFRLSWRNNVAFALGMRPAVRTRVLLGNYLSQYWLPGGPDNDFQVEF